MKTRTGHLITIFLHLVTGVLIIVGILMVLQNLLNIVQVQSTPAGFQIIRPPDEVSTLLIENNTVWTGGKDGVILIDRITGKTQEFTDPAPSWGYVRSIIKDRSGSIWVGHDGGLTEYRNGTWIIHAPRENVPFSKVLSITQRHDGRLVIGTETDVLLASGKGWESLWDQNGSSLVSADVLFEDRENLIWVGDGSPVHGGLYQLDGTTWHSFSILDGLPHNSVRMISQSDDGAVWIATGFSGRGGAARIIDGTLTSITKADGLAGESTRSVYQDTTGRMWIGSEYDGIAVQQQNGTWKILTAKDGLAGNEVKVMKQDQDGTYWLGTNNGLSRITDKYI